MACGAAPVGSSIGELLLVASEKGLLQDFDLPLDERGSAFQLRAWAALRALPPTAPPASPTAATPTRS